MRPTLPLLLLLVGCTSPQVKRAREFVQAEEYESARQELRVELKNHPDNTEAKALLLFMELADSTAGDKALEQCLFLDASAKNPASTAAEESIKASKLAVRKAILDRGIPTEDWAEYEGILRTAVDYGWSKHKYSEGTTPVRLTFAFCEALDGDDAAMAYIVDHLATEDPQGRARAYLYTLGERAVPALTKVASQEENLAAAGAEETLKNLLLAGQVIRFSKNHKDHVALTSVRAGKADTTALAAGKFLLQQGWKDDNKSLKDVVALTSVLTSFSGADAAPRTMEDYQVAVRQVKVGEIPLAFLTLAVPASQAPTAEGALVPAGVGTSFLTEAWQWARKEWRPLTLDGKPSIAGADQVLLSVTTAAGEPTLGPDQALLVFYRGLETTTEDMGWFGTYSREKARVDKLVYHLGPTDLTYVKDLVPPARPTRNAPQEEWEFMGD